MLAGHSQRGKIVYAGQDVESGELLVVSQWQVKCTIPKRKGSHGDVSDPELANTLKQVCLPELFVLILMPVIQLTSLDQEMHMLSKLSHPGILKYRGLASEHSSSHFILSILQVKFLLELMFLMFVNNFL